MKKYFKKVSSIILYSLIFLFPFFFLNFTQEYFITNKLYFLGFGVLTLLIISTIQVVISKRLTWQKNYIDGIIIIFLTSVAISTFFSSPNKIQALLNPNLGLIMMILLTILYFYISQNNRTVKQWNNLIFFSSFFLSLMTIILYFQPFNKIALPQSLIFLKNSAFTPVGSQLDLAIFLGFGLIIGLTQILKQINTDKKFIILNTSYLILNLLALFLTVYSLIKPVTIGQNTALSLLPPFKLSWFATLETLKKPLTAIFGIGPDNFSVIFTRVKDFAYNQSPNWQIDSFNVSHSAILQILTETGILGLLSFGLLIFTVFRKSISYPFIYLIICLLIFPPSLIVWFLFFVILGLTDTPAPALTKEGSADLTDLLPIYFGVVVISFILIGASSYFLGRSYASEYYFKKSVDGIARNNLKDTYNYQRQAIVLNPYIERFRSSFSKTNLLIANNLSSNVKNKKLSEQDRQTITQAIQAGIAEGKVTVSLNPQKAGHWQNLASIYQNIIDNVEGADVWTISAYQRAILADPKNPVYRVGLGGVYYSQKKYNDALKFFEQAISLKPDWPNANYNLAWTNFQLKNYPQAVNAMQNTLDLLNAKLNKADYEKVQKELEEFKKKLPL